MSEEFNAYPTSTRYFFPKEPVQQAKDKEAEIKQTLEELPLLNTVVQHLDERIAFYDTLESIQVPIDTDPATFQKVVEANKLTVKNLKAERSYIINQVDKARK